MKRFLVACLLLSFNAFSSDYFIQTGQGDGLGPTETEAVDIAVASAKKNSRIQANKFCLDQHMMAVLCSRYRIEVSTEVIFNDLFSAHAEATGKYKCVPADATCQD